MMSVTTLLSFEDVPSPSGRTSLRAGPLSLVYENGDLRTITCDGHRILLRLYAAVRDRNWATVPGTIEDERIETRPDSFRITYRSVHRQEDVDFVWQAAIVGDAAGTLTFDFEGEAHATFLRNRIGFCILHPAECAGTVCTVEHADGSHSTAPLPERIVPDQPVLPFAEMRGFTQPLPSGGRVTMRFSGDIFEMEDQRNWTDASYKTFCTPLRLPYPVEVPVGTRIQQRVEIRAEVTVGKAAPSRESAAVAIRLHPGERKPLPAIGFGLSLEEAPMTAFQAEKLRALRPAHLRADLRLGSPNWEQRWERAQDEAAALNTALELALLLPAERPEAALSAAVRLSSSHVPLARCLILPDSERMLVTPDHARLLAAAHETLAFTGPFAAGTNSDFLFANRFPPPMAVCDALVFSLNPQVHAFDDASLVETLATQATAVRSAQPLAEGKPVLVSPVTLLPRHNPYATAPQSPDAPPPADPRQKTSFGAVWTLGSVKYLAESGASSITFYETVGPRGLLEGDTLFPLSTVFAEIAGFVGGSVLPTVSSDPLRVEAFALTDGARKVCWLANMTPTEQRAVVEDAEEILLPPFGLMRIEL